MTWELQWEYMLPQTLPNSYSGLMSPAWSESLWAVCKLYLLQTLNWMGILLKDDHSE